MTLAKTENIAHHRIDRGFVRNACANFLIAVSLSTWSKECLRRILLEFLIAPCMNGVAQILRVYTLIQHRIETYIAESVSVERMVHGLLEISHDTESAGDCQPVVNGRSGVGG